MQALVLLTGFLGAGKTTALRRLALGLSGRGLAVHAVLNDYRNAEIDSATLRDAVGQLASISGSCVCCDSRDELFDSLATLPRDEPGLVLIEANGGADPAEIVELLALDPRCRHLAPPQVITLIHAKRWQKRLFRRGLERDQVRPATHFMLSHSDEVEPERPAKVRLEVARTNPLARETEIEVLIDQLEQLTRQLQGQADRQLGLHRLNPLNSPGPSSAHGAHPFASLELALPRPIKRAALEQFLDQLPEQVLRAKALVELEGEPQLQVLQRTDERRNQWIPVELNHEWKSTLVLIGPDLDGAALEEALARSLEESQ